LGLVFRDGFGGFFEDDIFQFFAYIRFTACIASVKPENQTVFYCERVVASDGSDGNVQTFGKIFVMCKTISVLFGQQRRMIQVLYEIYRGRFVKNA
jgi:hypothetical protein